jgi:hypothetical protein
MGSSTPATVNTIGAVILKPSGCADSVPHANVSPATIARSAIVAVHLWWAATSMAYWRAMCMRSSASVSWISLPLTSTVTLWMVPVNLNGLG